MTEATSNPDLDHERFERWVREKHPQWWPNPNSNGSRWHPSGFYVNRMLNAMWLAWQEAKRPFLTHIATLGHVVSRAEEHVDSGVLYGE